MTTGNLIRYGLVVLAVTRHDGLCDLTSGAGG